MIAALRGDLFFSSRKGAETQRNCGLIGLTFRRGGLALRLCAPNTFFIFYSRKAHRGGQNKPIFICIINFQMSQRWNYNTMIEYVTIRKLMFFLKV
jgi:hypothetical protein